MDEYRQTRYLLGNSPENVVKPTKSGEQLEIEAKLFRMQMDDEQAARWVPGISPYQSKEERVKTMSILPEAWQKFNARSSDDRSHFFTKITRNTAISTPDKVNYLYLYQYGDVAFKVTFDGREIKTVEAHPYYDAMLQHEANLRAGQISRAIPLSFWNVQLDTGTASFRIRENFTPGQVISRLAQPFYNWESYSEGWSDLLKR